MDSSTKLNVLTSGASQQYVTALLNVSGGCIKFISLDGKLTYMSGNGRKIMDVDDFSAIEGKAWWELWPVEQQARVKQAVQDAASGKPTRFSAFCPTKKGIPKWWDVGVSPVYDEAGKIISIVSISHDVSDKHKAQEQLEAVALELRHRLKNAFAVSGALAKLSAGRDPAKREFAEALAARYRDLAVAQSKLLDKGSQGLAALLRGVVAPYGDNLFQMDVDGAEGLVCNESQSRAVALIVGELATNSAKYGALKQGANVELRAAFEDGAVRIFWQEKAAYHEGPSTDGGGTGLRVMTRMATAIGGDFNTSFADGHLKADFTFPLS